MEKRRITQKVVKLFEDTDEDYGNFYVMRDRIVIMDAHHLKKFVASMQDINQLIIENKKGATNSENVD